MTSSFAELGLLAPLLRAVNERGYAQPTSIQSAAIPPALQGRDVLGCAQTGSGKTAAFALPLLQRSAGLVRSGRRRPWGLVLVPTRELATQVGESIRGLSQHLSDPLKIAVVFGGVSINPQMMGLRGGADVLVATPGRLLDLVDRNAVDLAEVSLLVLDEADRLLDEGFGEELSRLLALLPLQRQHLFFSATFPPAVQTLAQTLLHHPVQVDVPSTASSAPAVAQRAVAVDAAMRTPLLRHLMAQGGWTQVLVFVATRYATEHVADKLRRAGFEAQSFHGDLSQGARTKALVDFRSGALRVLVATDMAARGIHIEGLPVVVNYDLPRSAVDYVHRIGRTARAGAEGLAVSFVSVDTERHFQLIEKRQGRQVPRERIAGFEPKDVPAATAAAEGGVKGKRKSKKDKLREAAGRGG